MDVLAQPLSDYQDVNDAIQEQDKINVVHVVQHLSQGGIETMAVNMVNSLEDKLNMHLLSLTSDSETILANWSRASAINVPWKGMQKSAGVDISLINRLADYFHQNDIDVVHTHHIGPLLYAGLAAKKANCRIIHTEHDAWHLSSVKHRWLQKLLLTLLKPIVIADATAVSKAFEQYLHRPVDDVIVNGIDLQTFVPGNQDEARQTLGLPKGVKLVGSAGRLETVKGHHYLIEALSLLPSEYHLAIAGNGSLLRELQKQVQALNITQRVHFLGHIENVTQFYQALDCFCLPSLKEGYPLSSLEAQACDIPVVLTDVGGSKDTLCPLSGISVLPQNSHLLAQGVQQSLSNKVDSSPRKHVCEHNNFMTTMDRYYGHYAKGITL
jgi:glycosyltransferase involved in cell wall biosynthesis